LRQLVKRDERRDTDRQCAYAPSVLPYP